MNILKLQASRLPDGYHIRFSDGEFCDDGPWEELWLAVQYIVAEVGIDCVPVFVRGGKVMREFSDFQQVNGQMPSNWQSTFRKLLEQKNVSPDDHYGFGSLAWHMATRG